MSAQALAIETDVLVIGGSLAGAWAALSARQAGARVVVVDKGWIGSAGIVAAATGGGYFLLPDDPDQRARTITIRHDQAEGFDDLAFCEKVYEQSYRCYRQLAEWGFRAGRMGSFRGPDSMVFLRRQLLKMGVKVLDHSPALDLLAAADGSMAGARGVHRKTGQPWEIRSAAVILATGGNAFRSGALGTGGSTGDGYLLAAEAGAGAVGMEFSGHYGFVARGSSCTKGGCITSMARSLTRRAPSSTPSRAGRLCLPPGAR
jgi:succinate dehydrogenase/fumarate reductase flavoprotein subunit